LTVRETLKFAGDLSLPRYVLVFFSAYYQIPLPCQRVLIQSPLVM
jgi:hypothetical protein